MWSWAATSRTEHHVIGRIAIPPRASRVDPCRMADASMTSEAADGAFHTERDVADRWGAARTAELRAVGRAVSDVTDHAPTLRGAVLLRDLAASSVRWSRARVGSSRRHIDRHRLRRRGRAAGDEQRSESRGRGSLHCGERTGRALSRADALRATSLSGSARDPRRSRGRSAGARTASAPACSPASASAASESLRARKPMAR